MVWIKLSCPPSDATSFHELTAGEMPWRPGFHYRWTRGLPLLTVTVLLSALIAVGSMHLNGELHFRYRARTFLAESVLIVTMRDITDAAGETGNT